MFDFQKLLDAIEGKPDATVVFFRDDDVGWAAERLRPLCVCLTRRNIPLDLAVIPGAIDRRAASAIIALYDEFAPLLHLHQHGYFHVNHQTSGRKCEFGTDRSEEDQALDIASGKKRLTQLFGDRIEPIFTPPWNRCTDVTGRVLRQQGFQVLSRLSASDDIETPDLREIPVIVDWQKMRNGHRLGRDELLAYASRHFIENDTVGVMLHHEHMDDGELSVLYNFLGQLFQSSKIVFQPMININNGAQDAGQST